MTPYEIIKNLDKCLKSTNIPFKQFGEFILYKKFDRLKMLYRKFSNSKWNELKTSDKTVLKLIHAWVTDENRVDKLKHVMESDASYKSLVYDISNVNIESKLFDSTLLLLQPDGNFR